MRVTCRGFSASPLANGEIELVIAEPKRDAAEERLSLGQVGLMLRKSIKALHKLSLRKKNPLPIYRGNGRPYAFRHEINDWLRSAMLGSPEPPFSPHASTVFGSPTS